MTDELITREEGGIGHVVFNRPQARNALTFAMYEGIAAYCAEPPRGVRAIVVSGAGQAFAAGTDMTQFRAFSTPEQAHDYERKMDRVFTAIEQCPVPTLAAIDGACTGGGAGIAGCCDLRIASARLKFGFPIARTLGNCLSAANLARLSALMGAGRVREMIFLARLIEAEEALRIGLVTEVLPDGDALMARAVEMAERLAGMAPLTLRATKEGLRRLRAATEVDDSDLIELCYTSEDFREGMEAFLAKRKPEWRGR
ncbi:MAG TPA: enoyl-CoA hydratase/isomerase family protein [Thermohalobaculum sp.]|nr:enoyl-CoA hydratase/isomerase family protein [Thermohalobaculum sp.]